MIGKLVWKVGTSRLGFLAAGAGLAYFLDPDKGARRRTDTVQKAQQAARQEAKMVTGDA
jgi:hypothetical protein